MKKVKGWAVWCPELQIIDSVYHRGFGIQPYIILARKSDAEKMVKNHLQSFYHAKIRAVEITFPVPKKEKKNPTGKKER